ncbi:hypothetical protein F4809DRAFT_653384 [Biscogniauxia mediterranea]|nr:hypothetical protein F4809DRAFT_653384 [Biscogniauxia mediterranea]
MPPVIGPSSPVRVPPFVSTSTSLVPRPASRVHGDGIGAGVYGVPVAVDTGSPLAREPSGKNVSVKTTVHDLLDPGGHNTPSSTRGLSPTSSSGGMHRRHRHHTHNLERGGNSGGGGGWGPVRFVKDQWRRNKAPIMVLASQLFGALMNLGARILELDHDDDNPTTPPMHPMQILLVRMVLTTVATSVYIRRARVPGGLLGPRPVRGLLVARGVAGFLGVYGMWYSAMYLPLAEATVITFLAPNLAGYMCHVLIGDAFTRAEQGASLVALAGVALIARPGAAAVVSGGGGGGGGAVVQEGMTTVAARRGLEEPDPTTLQRLAAVGMALLGVAGSAASLTTMRWIGTRAHPLTSINYFSAGSAAVAAAAAAVLALERDETSPLPLPLPPSPRRAALLLLVSAAGLAMLVLLTAGLAAERSNRATAMLYTHMLFAAGFDRWVFGTRMGWASLLGCGLILGSAAWAALTREGVAEEERGDVESRRVGEEEEEEGVPILGAEGEDAEERGGGEDVLGGSEDEEAGAGWSEGYRPVAPQKKFATDPSYLLSRISYAIPTFFFPSHIRPTIHSPAAWTFSPPSHQ